MTYTARKRIIPILIVFEIVLSIYSLIHFSLLCKTHLAQMVSEQNKEPITITYVTQKIISWGNEKSRYELTDNERALVEQIVACEAGADTFEGQMAVAQCIYNSAIIDETDIWTVFKDYRYGTYKREVTDENRLAVKMIFDYSASVTQYPIQWYVTPECASGSWHEKNMTFAGQIGAHRFYYNADLIGE